jgi:hypothetical protein
VWAAVTTGIAQAASGLIHQVYRLCVNSDFWHTLSHQHRLQGLLGTGSDSRHHSLWASFLPVSLHYSFEIHHIYPLCHPYRPSLTSLTHALWYQAESFSSGLSALSSSSFSVCTISLIFISILFRSGIPIIH